MKYLFNKYEITWLNTDITFCGYFSGTITNIQDWIFANLGYNNKIKDVTNIETNVKYSIGDYVYFTSKVLNSDLKDVTGATIKCFYIDWFSNKIGAKFEEK